MVMSGFICGTSSLPKEDDDDYERHTRSADSSPRKCRSKSTGGSTSNNKNPYSNRGLDRFSALLSEIEEKRQQIYSQVDPNEISLVRFMYAGDHEFKPIVVKAKPKGGITIPNHQAETDHKPSTKPTEAVVAAEKSPRTSPKKVAAIEAETDTRNENGGFKKRLLDFRVVHPRFYLAVVFILILVFLVVFGRSFAIMCTSIGWYLVPTITNTSSNSKRSTTTSLNSKASFNKKKDLGLRRLSDKKLIMTKEGSKSFKHPEERQCWGRKSI